MMQNLTGGQNMNSHDGEKAKLYGGSGIGTFLAIIISSSMRKEWPMKAEKDNMVLPIGFGKDTNGRDVVRDLAKLPHLLIGGMTGSGKSVFLHSLICSLAESHSPKEVQFLLIDPKMVEFMVYERLPHLLEPVQHDTDKAIAAVQSVEAEMDKRLTIFHENSVRDIASYNDSAVGEKMPRIIIVVDEVSDMIIGMEGEPNNEFVSTASRIGARGRAAGIHLVMATSRTDSIVLSEPMKASIPARLAFKLYEEECSQAILDAEGAEKLRDSGDALLRDSVSPIRVHVPLISDADVSKIVDSVCRRSNNG